MSCKRTADTIDYINQDKNTTEKHSTGRPYATFDEATGGNKHCGNVLCQFWALLVNKLNPECNSFKRKTFTLVELLFVISIISILMTLLMPALSKVKQKGESILCVSNQKQLSLALGNYLCDNNTWCPPYAYDVSTTAKRWVPLLFDYLPPTLCWF